MIWLRNIPFWGWFLVTLIISYGIWNPWDFSITSMWLEDSSLETSIKVLITLLVFVLVLLFVMETLRTLGFIGLIFYTAVIGVVLWVFWDLGWLTKENLSNAKYWAQIPFAFLLTLGTQGTKIYRSMTGRVGVDDPDTVHPDDD